MVLRSLSALIVGLALAPAAGAGVIPHEVLAMGEDGPAAARQEVIESQAALDRWPGGLKLGDSRRTLVAIALGEQPAGTRLRVELLEADARGFSAKVLTEVEQPVQASGTTRPWLIVSCARTRLVRCEAPRVRLQLGEALLGPFDVEQATAARERLLALSRRERARVAALSQGVRAQRARLAELEQAVLAQSRDPAYRAAVRALGREASLRRSIEMARFETSVAMFGTSLNPFLPRGDEGLPRLPARDAQASFEADYAEEAASLQARSDELQAKLEEIRALAATPAPQPDSSGQGLVGGVSQR